MNDRQTMSGVVLTGHGGPEMLEWRDNLQIPQPATGEVLIRISAAGVNNTDVNTRSGWYSKTVSEATKSETNSSPSASGHGMGASPGWSWW